MGRSWGAAYWEEGHGPDAFWRRAAPVRVVDGNTIEWVADLGFGVTIMAPLSRINVWGVKATRKIGVDQKTRTQAADEIYTIEQWLAVHAAHPTTPGQWPFMLRPEKLLDGRYECLVVCAEGHMLNEDLLMKYGFESNRKKAELKAVFTHE